MPPLLLFTSVTSPAVCDSIPLLILIVFHEVRNPLLSGFTHLRPPPFPPQCPPFSPSLVSPQSPLPLFSPPATLWQLLAARWQHRRWQPHLEASRQLGEVTEATVTRPGRSTPPTVTRPRSASPTVTRPSLYPLLHQDLIISHNTRQRRPHG